MRGQRTAYALGLAAALTGCSSARLPAVELESQTLSRELLAHWSFDEGSGTTAHDDSGNARDGQLTGGTWLQDGEFGGALRFADSEYVSVERFPDATSSFTVSAWVRLASYAQTGSDDQWTSVVSTEQMGGWEVNVDHLEAEPGLHFGYWKGPGTGDYVGHSCLGAPIGSWNQIVGMVEPTNVTDVSFTIYLNGQLCFQTTTPHRILPGSATLDIGQSPWGGRFLVADVDDISIWGRALVPAEVDLLNRTPPPPGAAPPP
jgi:hypothetical protein